MKRAHSQSSSASDDTPTAVEVYAPPAAKAIMIRPSDDDRLCVFRANDEAAAMQSSATWIDELMYNLKRGNFTVVTCDSPNKNLLNSLLKVQHKLNIGQYMQQLYPDVSEELAPKLVIRKPKPPRLVYEVGMHVHGGKLPFYFVDNVVLRRCVSDFGEFMTARWTEMNAHNSIFAQMVLRYNSWEGEMITMRDNVIIKLPNDKAAFARMFFDIKRQTNEEVYDKGIGGSEKQVMCEMFDAERFDEMFQFNMVANECTPSDEVNMIMVAIIDGFRQGKDDIEMETVNNKKVKERWFSLAVQPVAFFNIEK
uniref:DBP n=1 Tax=Lymantria dispar multicapsid nuclear polyhedrosis virus TaxID=10449 RepID=A0A0D3QVJ5_NPVLD|nr:dbp2 [Lymantria dispar multiple nucleopolyhedrovirus]AMO27545.1 DBP [Lymantria dispar multiple nucleopolyhedrovirus]AMO27718.1 DBP [Lymantria dispar multiple nucleopolyhedrovirus]AQQ80068.1 dbp2 [Lymantria dispar multiple nucleopolyhedrovirus]QDE14902.1 ssDNA binding [Lymantria dispar multiple nucleopolyhedrovirus]